MSGGAACLNCEAALHGPYCAACGQRALPPRPTLRELAEEAWQELGSVDGKVARTVGLLLARPGALTAEALAGRRARYIGPVRLYLLCSLTFFFVSALIPDEEAGERRRATRASVAGALGTPLPKSCRPNTEPVGPVIRRLRELDCKTDRDPERFEAVRRANVPRLMFVMLPLYAGILAAAFRGHTYPEHLYFALHLHAFVFLAMVAARAADVLPSKRWDGIVDAAVMLAVAGYSFAALRRVYGRGWGATLARGVVVGGVYGTLFLLGLLGLVLSAALLM